MNHGQYMMDLAMFRDGLDSSEHTRLETVIRQNTKSPVVSFGYSYFLGWLGVDRFRIGHKSVGLLKLTLGLIMLSLFFYSGMLAETYGVYSNEATLFETLGNVISFLFIIDYFLIGTATRRYNMRKIREIMSQRDIWTKPE